MSKKLTTIVRMALLLLAAFLVGQVWWYMWMYHGWFGSPGILHQFRFSDGEASYNNTLFEMMLISLLLLLAVYIICSKIGLLSSRRRTDKKFGAK